MFFSRCVKGKVPQYGLSIVKNKYSKNEKCQKQDLMLFSADKIKELCNWISNLDAENWGENFFDNKKSLVLECDCRSEYLVTLFDKEEKTIYIVIMDNYWFTKSWHRKYSTEVYFTLEEGKTFAKDFLTKVKSDLEKN